MRRDGISYVELILLLSLREGEMPLNWRRFRFR